MKIIIVGDMHFATAEELEKIKEIIKLLSNKKSKIAIISSDHFKEEATSQPDITELRSVELIMKLARLTEEIREDMIFKISKPRYDKKAAQKRERAKVISGKCFAKNNIRHIGKSWAIRKSRKKFR